MSLHLRKDQAAPKADELYQGLDERDVLLYRNSYVCSKPVTGHHPTTGHILRIGDDDRTREQWLCLSPACDLVPGQRNTGWHKLLGGHLPFIAVRLFPDSRQCQDVAHRGNHIFLTRGDEVTCFAFSPSANQARESSNEVQVAPDDAAPKWEQMFAHAQGCCGEDFTLRIARIEAHGGRLTVKTSTAAIVAQLRYEYALNLLHRLGTTLSRVGLDFVSLAYTA